MQQPTQTATDHAIATAAVNAYQQALEAVQQARAALDTNEAQIEALSMQYHELRAVLDTATIENTTPAAFAEGQARATLLLRAIEQRRTQSAQLRSAWQLAQSAAEHAGNRARREAHTVTL